MNVRKGWRYGVGGAMAWTGGVAMEMVAAWLLLARSYPIIPGEIARYQSGIAVAFAVVGLVVAVVGTWGIWEGYRLSGPEPRNTFA